MQEGQRHLPRKGGVICCRKSKNLQDTQKALKEQKKKCALEIKNAMKRKQRLQGKASQLSDSDLVGFTYAQG